MMYKYNNTKTCNFYRGGWAASYGSVYPVCRLLCYNYDDVMGVGYGFRVTIF